VLPPIHHKELVQFLKGKCEGAVSVHLYWDEYETRSIPIAAIESSKETLYSTLGVCDKKLAAPTGHYEFASIGNLPWLPNVLASSLFWFEERSCEDWPLICEDVVKLNARSTYRHMMFVPSEYAFVSSAGFSIRWLLGIPVKDSELQFSAIEAYSRAKESYPEWLFNSHA
jgi:hypothetical protein